MTPKETAHEFACQIYSVAESEANNGMLPAKSDLATLILSAAAKMVQQSGAVEAETIKSLTNEKNALLGKTDEITLTAIRNGRERDEARQRIEELEAQLKSARNDHLTTIAICGEKIGKYEKDSQLLDALLSGANKSGAIRAQRYEAYYGHQHNWIDILTREELDAAINGVK